MHPGLMKPVDASQSGCGISLCRNYLLALTVDGRNRHAAKCVCSEARPESNHASMAGFATQIFLAALAALSALVLGATQPCNLAALAAPAAASRSLWSRHTLAIRGLGPAISGARRHRASPAQGRAADRLQIRRRPRPGDSGPAPVRSPQLMSPPRAQLPGGRPSASHGGPCPSRPASPRPNGSGPAISDALRAGRQPSAGPADPDGNPRPSPSRATPNCRTVIRTEFDRLLHVSVRRKSPTFIEQHV